MRRVGFRLPEPVLTGHAKASLEQVTAAAGGLWFSADTAFAAVCAETGGAVPPLLPLRCPEDEAFWPLVSGAGARLATGPRGRRVLALTAGVNGGYGDAEPLRRIDRFSAAVVWAPSDAPAKTLLALRGASRHENYLFLTEDEAGVLVLRDNSESVRVEARYPAGRHWMAALISVSGGTLSLALAEGEVQRAEGLGALPERARLLVGCRAPREGMPKSLGNGRISDVLYWPGLDILSGFEGAAIRAAFDDFRLWEL